MWKKFGVLMASVVTSFALFAQSANAQEYKEGVNYQIRNDKLTATQEIREFFSFWCGHCFNLQGTFDAVRDAFPQANFVHNPVDMLGGSMGAESQRALVVASNLGLEDVYVKTLFNAMHREGKIPMSHADFTDFMDNIGIAKERFEREYSSFVINGKVASFNKWAQDVDLDAVPEILINGKYLVVMESVNDENELKNLIKYLLNKDNVPAHNQ